LPATARCGSPGPEPAAHPGTLEAPAATGARQHPTTVGEWIPPRFFHALKPIVHAAVTTRL